MKKARGKKQREETPMEPANQASVVVQRFMEGLRVLVDKDENDEPVGATGVVWRVCTDGHRGIIVLDGGKVLGGGGKEWKAGAKVRTYPEHCKFSETNLQEEREAVRQARQPLATLESFGRDHWTTFLYIEVRCVDHGGIPNKVHMRCDRRRHPWFVHMDPADGLHEGGYPTRLRGGAELHDHDDWDCVADLIAEGLLENLGSAINPVYRLTAEGVRVASLLRVYKSTKKTVDGFSPTWASSDSGHAAQAAIG